MRASGEGRRRLSEGKRSSGGHNTKSGEGKAARNYGGRKRPKTPSEEEEEDDDEDQDDESEGDDDDDDDNKSEEGEVESDAERQQQKDEEAFSDFGETDDELLLNNYDEETEAGEVHEEDEGDQSRATSSRSFSKDEEVKTTTLKKDDLLEGISDEDLSVSDDDAQEEDKLKKAKMADALGVDWSRLMKKGHEDEGEKVKSTTLMEKWSLKNVIRTFGLATSFLSPAELKETLNGADLGDDDREYDVISVVKRSRFKETLAESKRIGAHGIAVTARVQNILKQTG